VWGEEWECKPGRKCNENPLFFFFFEGGGLAGLCSNVTFGTKINNKTAWLTVLCWWWRLRGVGCRVGNSDIFQGGGMMSAPSAGQYFLFMLV
jgi:hypothetical protein